MGRTTLKVASRKMAKHEKTYFDNKHIFIQFAFDIFDTLTSKAANLLKRVQNVMHSDVVSPKSMNAVFQRLSFTIQKGLIAQLVVRLIHL
jgi:hypothetical protein